LSLITIGIQLWCHISQFCCSGWWFCLFGKSLRVFMRMEQTTHDLIHDDGNDSDDDILIKQLIVMFVDCWCATMSVLYKYHFYNTLLPYSVMANVDSLHNCLSALLFLV
jgi:hypothetical protein